MNNSIKNMFIFAAGVVIGSLATVKLVKDKYEKIAQEEIDSVKEVFSQKENEIRDILSDAVSDEEADESIDECEELIRNNGYINYSKTAEPRQRIKKEKDVERPYVISPDEFGELDDYRQISLTYYADHVLVDKDNELVEDVDDTVGFDSLNHFGEYEDDSVFVRNDRIRCDFEILLDQRRYSDVVRRHNDYTRQDK